MGTSGHGDPGPEAVLAGLLEIADERMAEAIRAISLRRGFDPAGHALVAFGGAGAQHACAVAGLLAIASVVVPADAGLLSALGLGAAVVERFAQRQVLEPLARVRGAAGGLARGPGRGGPRRRWQRKAWSPGRSKVRRRLLNLRFAGQEASLAVEYQGEEMIESAFDAAYREIYGYAPEGREIELESVRVVASSRLPPRRPGRLRLPNPIPPLLPEPAAAGRALVGKTFPSMTAPRLAPAPRSRVRASSSRITAPPSWGRRGGDGWTARAIWSSLRTVG